MTLRKTLWMRFVDFENIRKLLHLINENNGQLRAGELERLGIRKGILIKKGSGEPMTHTPRYHYRKVMENLGLVEVRQKRYYVSENKRTQDFLEITGPNSLMSCSAKEILGEIIVANEDCRSFFFDLFIEENSYDLETLRKRGNPITAETKSMRRISNEKWKELESDGAPVSGKKRTGPIVLRNHVGREVRLRTQDEIQAVYWGVRLWALRLGITDEMMYDFIEGRIIYPVNMYFSQKILIEEINRLIKMNKRNTEWTLIHIPDFIKEIASKYRFSIDEIKDFLVDMKMSYPSSVMFVPSSTVFIDIKTPYERQDPAIRSLYLYRNGKGYISHMRIRKRIFEEVVE